MKSILFLIFLPLCVAQVADLSASSKSQWRSVFGSPVHSSRAAVSLRRLRRQKLEKISTHIQSAEYSDLINERGNGIIQSYKSAFEGNWDSGLASIGCAALTMAFAWIGAQPFSLDILSKAKVVLFVYALMKLLDASYLVSHELSTSEGLQAPAVSAITVHSPQFATSDDGEMTVFAMLSSLGLSGKDANFLRVFTSLGLRELTLIVQSFWVLLLVAVRPLLPADTTASIHDLLFNASVSTFACEATEVNMSLTSAPSELVAIISMAFDAVRSLTDSFRLQRLLTASVVLYVGYHYIAARGKHLYSEPVVKSLFDSILIYSNPLIASVAKTASEVKNKFFSNIARPGTDYAKVASTKKPRLSKSSRMRKKTSKL
jgi:hypothetical protein